VLFAVLSAFAVSFGISSWGVTDSTAMLPRTLVLPLLIFCMWWWCPLRRPPLRKYLVFPFLVLGSLLHLSTFYLAAVLFVVEVADFLFLRTAPRRA
jgi:hypothetical protein